MPHRIDDIEELTSVASSQLSFGRGLLITNPVPEGHALDQAIHDAALGQALFDAEAANITGAAITPFVLDRMATASEGRSVPANVALVANNARLAGELAAALRESSGN